MATTPITATALAATGYNLADSADFATLTTGAGNGVEFKLDVTDIVVLKNDTGGAAVFTLKVPSPTDFSSKGVTIPDVTVTVAAGKTWVYKLSSIFKQADGDVIIECDVAGKVLVLSP